MKTGSRVLRGNSVQLLPFSQKDWKHIANWAYDKEYQDFFRQYPNLFTEEDLINYPACIGGEVLMIHSLMENDIVGMIQAVPCSKKNKAAFIGSVVSKEHQHKHFFSEANYLFLDHLFNRQGYNKVIIEILESSSDLKAGLDKAGFFREGKLLQECFIDGKFHNELRYSMSAYFFNKNRAKWLKEQQWVDSSKA